MFIYYNTGDYKVSKIAEMFGYKDYTIWSILKRKTREMGHINDLIAQKLNFKRLFWLVSLINTKRKGGLAGSPFFI
jgi:hypothetical protein